MFSAVRARESGDLDVHLDSVVTQCETTAFSLLTLLSYLRADRDCVLYSARAHLALTRLIGKYFDGEDGEDIAAACISECAKTLSVYGLGFPLEPGSLATEPSPILCFDFSTLHSDDLLDENWLKLGKNLPSLEDREKLLTRRRFAATCCDKISVRAVPSSLRRQESQEDVGQLLWPAAPPFCRWLVSYSPILFPSARRILEIGSGMGLSGIVAARLARLYQPEAEVVLTDFNQVVLHNLEQNVRLNEDEELCKNVNKNSGMKATIVEKLDWDEYRASSSSSLLSTFSTPFDLIIGSDMICSNEDALGVAAALERLLCKPSGVAVFVLAPEDVRWGVGALHSALFDVGINHSCTQLEAEYVIGEEKGTVAGGYEKRLNVHFCAWECGNRHS